MSAALTRPAQAAPPPLAAVAAELGYTSDWNWAWNSYRPFVERLAAAHGLFRHLEVGGGRDTLFSPAEAAARGFDVTVNDISATELALAPPAFRTLCCDMAAPETAALAPGAFDFAYSRMVMEHVRDARQLWANQYALLREGGVALAFFPTLFAPAFALNAAVPEAVSGAILRRLFPDRHAGGDNPKFPAHYSFCYGDEAKVAPMLREVGFREVLLLPFYGYSYFWKIPVLRELDAAFTRVSARRDWRAFTSFAYLVARK